MTNVDFLRKNWQKSRHDFQLRLHNDLFRQNVSMIRDFWDLPVPISSEKDLAETFSNASMTFWWDNLLRVSGTILRYTWSEIFPHIGTAEIAALPNLVNDISVLRKTENQTDLPDNWRRCIDEFGSQKLNGPSPDSARAIGDHLILTLLKSGFLQHIIKIPAEVHLTESLTLSGENANLLILALVVRWYALSAFLQDMENLLCKSHFGKEWLGFLILYVLTDIDLIAKGWVPLFDVFIIADVDGAVVFELTPSTTTRDVKAAMSLLQNPKIKPKRHHYPRRNQDRDLEILELTRRKPRDRERARQLEKLAKLGNEDDRVSDNEVLYLDDGDIASKVSPSGDLDRVAEKYLRDVIRHARSRGKTRIDRAYTDSA